MSEEIKPCPFCGGTSLSVTEGSSFRWRNVECAECCAMGPEVRHDTLAKDQKEAEAKSTALAFREWNQRK